MGAKSKYGGLVVNSSMIVHPTLQMSDADDHPAISITSGATTVQHFVTRAQSSAQAK
jgi:hypothetical protein